MRPLVPTATARSASTRTGSAVWYQMPLCRNVPSPVSRATAPLVPPVTGATPSMIAPTVLGKGRTRALTSNTAIAETHVTHVTRGRRDTATVCRANAKPTSNPDMAPVAASATKPRAAMAAVVTMGRRLR